MSFRGPEGNTRREPITTAVRMHTAVLVAGTDGIGWAVSTERGATAAATLVASANGGFAADDAMPSGGTVLRTPTRTIGTV